MTVVKVDSEVSFVHSTDSSFVAANLLVVRTEESLENTTFLTEAALMRLSLGGVRVCLLHLMRLLSLVKAALLIGNAALRTCLLIRD